MISVDVAVKSKKWRVEKNIEEFVKKIGEKIISLTDLGKILKTHIEVSVSLVSDQQMKKINFEFSQKNTATNVLSFSALDENLIRKIGIKKAIGASDHLFLGDIVIAYETLKKEAAEQRKKFADHLTHLLLHSVLHLIGQDHEEEKMAAEMENLEIKILKKLGIKNPYQSNS